MALVCREDSGDLTQCYQQACVEEYCVDGGQDFITKLQLLPQESKTKIGISYFYRKKILEYEENLILSHHELICQLMNDLRLDVSGKAIPKEMMGFIIQILMPLQKSYEKGKEYHHHPHHKPEQFFLTKNGRR